MTDTTGPKRAATAADAKGQQGEYQDNDGVGVIKGRVDARQGFWDSPVLVVLGGSLVLALIAAFVLYRWFSGAP